MAATVTTSVGNGVILDFDSDTIGRILSIDRDRSANPIDVSALEDDEDLYEAGSIKSGVKIEVKGQVSGLDVGDKGHVEISYPGVAQAVDYGLFVIMGMPEKIVRNQVVSTTIDFARTTATGS